MNCLYVSPDSNNQAILVAGAWKGAKELGVSKPLLSSLRVGLVSRARSLLGVLIESCHGFT